MRYQELRTWQFAMELAEEIYRINATLPISERYGLSAQMRSSARSIPANIAEGFGRGTTRDYLRFLGIATGSLFELETDLELVVRVRLLPEEITFAAREAIQRVARALTGQRRGLRKRLNAGND